MSKINKNTIPENFTIGLALVDLLPVLFFFGSGIILALIFKNIFLIISSIIVFISGLLKVIWKLIVVLFKRNVWPLFIQMRIIMPVGFLVMTGIIIYLLICNPQYNILKIFYLPQIIFFIFGICLIIAMIICSAKLDSSDLKSNWIEQIINSFAQGFVFIGLLLLYLV